MDPVWMSSKNAMKKSPDGLLQEEMQLETNPRDCQMAEGWR